MGPTEGSKRPMMHGLWTGKTSSVSAPLRLTVRVGVATGEASAAESEVGSSSLKRSSTGLPVISSEPMWLDILFT